jgi:membrane protein
LFAKHYKSVPWRHVAIRVVKETWNDDVFGRAAQLAYFSLFSLFPLLLIIALVLSQFAQGSQMRSALVDYLGKVIPGNSLGVVRDALSEITSGATAGKLSLGLLASIWAASSGMSAIIAGLNKAYEVPEARSWWKARLIAIALTAALTTMLVISLALLLYGSKMGAWLADRLGVHASFSVIWAALRWALIVIFALGAFLLVYRFAPHLRDQKLYWIAPGAVAGVASWLLVSAGLKLYIRLFSSYTVYGTVGSALVLLLWLYLSSAALLIGGEVNSEIENAAAENGDREAKHAGERSPNEAV